MNLCLHIHQINLPNLFFLDTKQNMVIDGKFTKLIYSNEYFTMNGLFLLFPLTHCRIENYANKTNYLCYPNNSSNQQFIQNILSLESDIVNLYKEVNHCRKKLSLAFANHLQTCSLKITRDFYSKTQSTDTCKRVMIIKISGVWESADEVGVTYKVTELYDI